MIEVKEIRIGNFTKVTKNGIISQFEIDDFDYLKEHEFIPLTEEWLLKFGFNKWKDKKIWTCKKVMIYFHAKEEFCFGRASNRTKLKYVHQLQNLYFALTGEELTIKE
jgi:hypothetical protein